MKEKSEKKEENQSVAGVQNPRGGGHRRGPRRLYCEPRVDIESPW